MINNVYTKVTIELPSKVLLPPFLFLGEQDEHAVTCRNYIISTCEKLSAGMTSEFSATRNCLGRIKTGLPLVYVNLSDFKKTKIFSPNISKLSYRNVFIVQVKIYFQIGWYIVHILSGNLHGIVSETQSSSLFNLDIS